MGNSAIGTPTFQALAGNIKNQDGSPAIYSAGVWSFENSSGVTTFTVSDAGAVTVGINGSAATLTHTVWGSFNFGNSRTSYFNTTSPNIYSTTTGGSGVFNEAGHLILEPRLSGAVRDVIIMGSSAAEVARFNGAGAVTLGPAGSIIKTSFASNTSTKVASVAGVSDNITLAQNKYVTVTVTDTTGWFVIVTEAGAGYAGVFFMDYASGTSVEVADPSGKFAVSGGTDFEVAKTGAGAYTFNVKNLNAASRSVKIQVIGATVSAISAVT